MRGASSGEFELPVRSILSELNKESFVITIRNLVLDRWELFEQILYESRFFDLLTMRRAENREQACQILSDRLQKAKVTLKSLYDRKSFDKAWKILQDEKVQQVFYRHQAARMRFQF